MFLKNNIKQSIFLLIFFSIINAQSLQELQKMKNEYEKIVNDQQKTLPLNIQNDIDPVTGLPKEVNLQAYQYKLLESDSGKSNLKHFGYDFFTQRDTISFWENLPTPSNYFLGSGDELIISIWGETQLRKTYTINRDGKIYDEKVGLLNLAGKTIENGEEYLKEQFGRVYSTIKGSNPSTFIDVSLGKLRSININFVGEVKYPGVYPVHPYSTVITGLIQAGGVDTTGSLRNIQIMRNNGLYHLRECLQFS